MSDYTGAFRGFDRVLDHGALVTENEGLRRKLRQQDEFLEGLKEQPLMLGRILAGGGGRVIVQAGPMQFDCKAPDLPTSLLTPGTVVRILNNNIHSVAGTVPLVGMHAKLLRLLPEQGSCVVNIAGQQERVMVFPKHLGVAKPGDDVVLDDGGHIVTAILARDAGTEPVEETGVSWDDIGGLAEAREAVREAIEYPLRYGDLYRQYGRKPSKGVMLYGPPGGGKTLIAKATATTLRELHGGKGGVGKGFIYVKGPEVLDKFVGASELAVRALFRQAREYKEATGFPAVVCIDEADALLGRRGVRTIGMEATIVPTFLAEMDGLHESAAFVMLLTNRPDVLDPAVTRDGRIDRRIEVKRPSREVATEIFEIAMRGIPVAGGADPAVLRADAIDLLFSDRVIVKSTDVAVGRTESGAPVGGNVTLYLRDVVSGALITGIVHRAIDRALRRDRESGATQPSGITDDDLRAAITASSRELGSTALHAELGDAAKAQFGGGVQASVHGSN